ncbi:MAG: hypothetical protein WBY94_16415 [Polyangiaceae bacterium]
MTRSVAKPTVVLVSPPPPLPLAPLLPAAPLLLLPPGVPPPVDPASAPGEPELPLVPPLLPAPALPDDDPPLLGTGEPLLPFETPDEPTLPELLLEPLVPAPTVPLELGVAPFPPAAEDEEPGFSLPPPLLVAGWVSPDGEPVDWPPLQFQMLAPASPARMVPNAVRAHPMCVFM